MTELACRMKKLQSDIEITVFCSDLAREDFKKKEEKNANYKGVNVVRVSNLGKLHGSVFSRIVFSVSFLFKTLIFCLLNTSKFDKILLTTNPPFLGIVPFLMGLVFKVPYIFEGHSFLTEGISPVNGNYIDGAYVKDIVDRYSNVDIKTYPLMTFWQFLKWIIIYRQKFIRPFWYIEYSKHEAQLELARRTGWQNYGGHHLENRASAFGHQVWQPRKFGVDWRILSISAKVRNGQLPKKEGLDEYNKPIPNVEQLELYVRKRLNFSNSQYKKIFSEPTRTWKDFKTYKKRFEILRPLFLMFAKAKLIPFSFYLKYCFPLKISNIK